MKTGNLLFQGGGWKIVQKEQLVRLGVRPNDPGFGPDGLYRSGDTILAFIPKELYEEKMKYKQEMSAVPLNQVKRFIAEGDPSIGGKDVHESMHGIQTQKDLKM